MTRKLIQTVRTALAGVLIAILLQGCGNSPEQRLVEQNRGRSARATAARMHLRQLEEKLRHIEIEQELLKKQVEAAKADLTAARDILASIADKYPVLRETTGVLTMTQAETDAETGQTQKQTAERNVISTILIILFIVFVIVWLLKIWRDKTRHETEGEAPDGFNTATASAPAAEQAAQTFTYPRDYKAPIDAGGQSAAAGESVEQPPDKPPPAD
ncbi:MAG: hypothetical protein WCK47_08735 [bacterium]|nr:hypothetical protein [Candidatus Sumerlaeota bacterium]